MAKIFEVDGYFNDDNSTFQQQLVTDSSDTPEGYTDDQIFFYGLTEAQLIGQHGDFTITSYREIEG